MSKINDWLERFYEMAAELQEHPRAAVTNLWVGEPVTDEEIESIEEELGFDLDDTIKEFYRQCNGLQFRWMDRGSEHFNKNNYKGVSEDREIHGLRGDWDEAIGSIDIFPIRKALLGEEDEYGMFEDYDDDEFDWPLHPFDVFGAFGSAGLLLDEDSPRSFVRIGSDHDTDFDDSDEIELSDYLEFILRHRGMIDPRNNAFIQHYRDRNQDTTSVIPADQPRPSLDTVLPDRSDEITNDDLKAGPVRVRAEAYGEYWYGETRGEIIEAPEPPSDWTNATEFIKVAFDVGGVFYVTASKVKTFKEPNTYERARTDLDAFLNELLAASPEDRTVTLLKIASLNTSWNSYEIQTQTGTRKLTLNTKIPRYLALLGDLETPDALQWLLTLLESFVDVDLSETVQTPFGSDELYDPSDYASEGTDRYEYSVNLLLHTIGKLAIDHYNKTPFESLRTEFGDTFADRLSNVLTTFGKYSTERDIEYLTMMLEFLTDAIEAFPGGHDPNQHLVSLFNYSTPRSHEFGIEGEPLPLF